MKRITRTTALLVLSGAAITLGGCAASTTDTPGAVAQVALQAIAEGDSKSVTELVVAYGDDKASLSEAISHLGDVKTPLSDITVDDTSEWTESAGQKESTVKVSFTVGSKSYDGTLKVVQRPDEKAVVSLDDPSTLLADVEFAPVLVGTAGATVAVFPEVFGSSSGEDAWAFPGVYAVSSTYPLYAPESDLLELVPGTTSTSLVMADSNEIVESALSSVDDQAVDAAKKLASADLAACAAGDPTCALLGDNALLQALTWTVADVTSDSDAAVVDAAADGSATIAKSMVIHLTSGGESLTKRVRLEWPVAADGAVGEPTGKVLAG